MNLVSSRRATLQKHRCGQHILVGLDADRAAITAQLDPYPLTPAGEVWALVNGRRTWQLNGTHLQPRDRWNIPGKPPNATRTVLTWHHCNDPIPTQHRAAPRPTKPQPTEETQCPF